VLSSAETSERDSAKPFDRPICDGEDDTIPIDEVGFCYESKPFKDWCIACVWDQRIWYAEEMDGGMYSTRVGLKDVPNWIYKRTSGRDTRTKMAEIRGNVKWARWGGSQKDRLLFNAMGGNLSNGLRDEQ